MAISFPSSPTVGQTYTVGSVTWTYDGSKWSGTASGIANLAGGSAGTVPYQSAASTTVQLAAGTAGYALKANGAAAPAWTNALSGVTSVNGSTVPASDTLVGRATTDTLTNKTLTSPAINNGTLTTNVVNGGIVENVSLYGSGGFGNGSVISPVSNHGVFYFTPVATSSGSLSILANSVIAVSQSVSMTVLVTNGATPYAITSLLIDGSSANVAVKWSGGTAPSAGNASSVDAYSFSIIKTSATPAYTVFAAGPIKYA